MKKIMFCVFICLFSIIFLTGCNSSEENKVSKNNEIKCNEGYLLKDGTCAKVLDNADAVASYFCDDGYTLDDDKNCVKVEIVDAKIDNPCPEGYNFSNGQCSKTITTNVIETKSCWDDGVLNGNVCDYKDVKPATVKYSCASGSGKYFIEDLGKCVKVSTTRENCFHWMNSTGFGWFRGYDSCYWLPEEPVVTYSCGRSSTLNGTNCVHEYQLNAVVKKSCPSGYQSSGNSCKKTVTTDLISSYYCDKGFSLNGTKCSRTNVKKSKIEYLCEDGFEVLGDKCFVFEEKSNDSLEIDDEEETTE